MAPIHSGINKAVAFSAKGGLARPPMEGLRRGSIRQMFYTYVLKSYKDGIRYIGSGENPKERLRRHNKGDYRFTKGHRPWQLIHQETYNTRSEAVRSERFLKSGKGREFLDSFLKK